MLIDKPEKMTVSSWVVVLLLATISIGTVGILNKMNHIDGNLTLLNKNYTNVMTRMAAQDDRITSQDARITGHDARITKLEVKTR